MPDTFFTAPPHWQWLVILYLFVGGLAGGAYFIAALTDLAGRPADQPLARLGYYVAFPATALGALFLTLDLGRPERFWHMLIQSETGWPMFKWWSPISFGSWAITVFGGVAVLSFLGTLAEDGYLRQAQLRVLRRGVPGQLIAAVGGLLGLFVAGYTGVLLTVTNRPIWADTNLLGVLFLLSGVSTAAAAIILFDRQRRAAPESVYRLSSMDSWIMWLELLVLVALVVSLGRVAQVLLSGWGVLLLVGVVLLGLLVPLMLHRRLGQPGGMGATTAAAALVLLGGFLLRVVIVLTSEGV